MSASKNVVNVNILLVRSERDIFIPSVLESFRESCEHCIVKMAPKKTWSKEERFSLITEFELYPELWDIKSTNYRNRIKKQNALKALAKKFETVESKISRKSHNLRTQFHQEIRRFKMKKSGDGAEDAYEITWEFFNSLKFINCDHSTTEAIDNLKQQTETLTEGYENSNNVVEMEDVVKNIQPEKKKKRGQCKKNEIQQDILLQKAADLMTKPIDEFQIFGDFVASEIKNLKSAEYQRQLKLTIQRAIVQFSELDISFQSTSDNSSSSSSRPPSAASYLTSFVANTREENVREHQTMHYNTQEQLPQSYRQGFGINTLTNDTNHLQQLS